MKFYNLHTHTFTNNPSVLELVNQYPWEFDAAIPTYSIGIHPWHIDENRVEADLKTIAEKLKLPECLALGECGLDKRIDLPMALQIEVFEKQIALAEQFQKPLVLHLVAAFDELIAIHKRLKMSVPIIIHGFSKNAQVANQLIDRGFYLSFGKYLVQSKTLGTTLEHVFKSVPNDRFFLETDTIAETLEEVYELAARIKGISCEELKVIVAENWTRVFR
jgi:TatD DNase family protein